MLTREDHKTYEQILREELTPALAVQSRLRWHTVPQRQEKY